MKSSLFNEYLGNIEGRWVLYNNLTSAMIDVTEKIYESLKSNMPDTLSNTNIAALHQAGFIVDNGIDELQMLREKKKELETDVAVIGLQILPVSFCDFRCIYCFEKPTDKYDPMSKETMDDIISWVKKTKKSTTKALNVMWFGGEPLLAVKQIEYLSQAFLEISKNNEIAYTASIVTNGYHLTETNIELLLLNGVKNVIVTIDGPEDIHDSRRMLKNGGKTWQMIINNIQIAVKKGLWLTIRINVDKTNFNNVENLFDNLEDLGILNSMGYIFGTVSQFGSACPSINDKLFSAEEFEILLKQKNIIKKLNNSNNSRSLIPANLIGCVASSKHSYVVGPQGELYKCTKTISDYNEICGNIKYPDSANSNYQKWLNSDNLNTGFCSNCSLIPICRGNVCSYEILKNNKKYENCKQKYNYPEYLKKLKIMYRNKNA